MISIHTSITYLIFWGILSLGANLTSSTYAATITFNLRDTNLETEIESGSFTQSGLTINLISNQGNLNQTASSFGVNNTAGSLDETSLLDGGENPEFIDISFDQTVLITGITLSSYSNGSDTADFSIHTFSPNDLPAQFAATDIYNFSTNNLLNIGETATIRWLTGNGFSFDSITVETTAVLVPEPSSLPLLIICFILLSNHRTSRISNHLKQSH